MNDELVKRLREHNGWALNETLDEAADAIEQLEAAVPKWIPVTERLPEKRTWVLCWCVSDSQEVLRWENNEWYHDPKHVYFSDFVTHWMPLPEPPKEDEA